MAEKQTPLPGLEEAKEGDAEVIDLAERARSIARSSNSDSVGARYDDLAERAERSRGKDGGPAGRGAVSESVEVSYLEFIDEEPTTDEKTGAKQRHPTGKEISPKVAGQIAETRNHLQSIQSPEDRLRQESEQAWMDHINGLKTPPPIESEPKPPTGE